MAYNANIPQPTDQLSVSQSDLLNNFQALNTSFTVNHVAFNVANQGKHFFIEMPVQSGDQATAASEMGMYCKTSALTSIPALFLRKQSSGLVTEWTSYFDDGTVDHNGWTILPSGLLLKFGFNSTLVGGSVVTTFPVAGTIPVFSSIFHVFIAPFNAGGGDPNFYTYVTAITTTNFTTLSVKRNSTGNQAAGWSYLAIGLPV